MDMYHFIGIKGTGMSSLALVMHSLGYDVQGSDRETHFFTEDALREAGIPILHTNSIFSIECDVINPSWQTINGSITFLFSAIL